MGNEEVAPGGITTVILQALAREVLDTSPVMRNLSDRQARLSTFVEDASESRSHLA